MKTEAQQRVATRILNLVRSKQDSMRQEELLHIIRCNRSNTREVFDYLVRSGQLRVSSGGKVMARAAVIYNEPTEIEVLDNAFIIERSI